MCCAPKKQSHNPLALLPPFLIRQRGSRPGQETDLEIIDDTLAVQKVVADDEKVPIQRLAPLVPSFGVVLGRVALCKTGSTCQREYDDIRMSSDRATKLTKGQVEQGGNLLVDEALDDKNQQDHIW